MVQRSAGGTDTAVTATPVDESSTALVHSAGHENGVVLEIAPGEEITSEETAQGAGSPSAGSPPSEDNLYSSYREVLLEHLFAGEVMKHLWCQGRRRMEVLKPQVDDSGYDLVLEANGFVRHVQLKSAHSDSSTARVTVNTALARKPSGCVVWLIFDPQTLELRRYLWFGGLPGEPLPELSGYAVAKHTKANAQGIKTARPNLRVVPRGKFETVHNLGDLVERLFGKPITWPISIETIPETDSGENTENL